MIGKRPAIALAASLAVLVAVYVAWRQAHVEGGGGNAAVAKAASHSAGKARAGVSVETVLAINPALGSASRPAAKAISPLLREVILRKDYKALHEKLKDSADGRTPEGQFALAEILDRCAKVADRKQRGNPKEPERVAARAAFVSSISARDPHRDKRIAAYDQVSFDPCNGLELEAHEADIDSLLRSAADGGDPKARMKIIQREAWKPAQDRVSFERPTGPGFLPSLSDAHIDEARKIALSGDPYAMVAAARVVGSMYENFHITAGPEERALDSGAYSDAWLLAACDFGYPCGSENPRVAAACAYFSQCDAATLRDFLFFYGQSPHRSQLVGEYLGEVDRVLRSGDWSYFAVKPGPSPSAATFTVPPKATQ